MHCHKGMGMHHRHFPIFPRILFATSIVTMAVGTVLSLWWVDCMTRAMETMAMTKALDEMGERLSDVERADLEGQIRSHLFHG